MPSPFQIHERPPTLEEYITLYDSVGEDTPIHSGEFLGNAVYSLVIIFGDSLIGMGRVIGDGRYLFIRDVVVHPDHQGNGVGRMIMRHIHRYLEKNASEGAIVSVVAPGRASSFFERFGYGQSEKDILLVKEEGP